MAGEWHTPPGGGGTSTRSADFDGHGSSPGVDLRRPHHGR